MRSHMLEATSGFPQSAAVSFDLRVRQLWLRRGSARALLRLRRETVVHVFARFSVERFSSSNSVTAKSYCSAKIVISRTGSEKRYEWKRIGNPAVGKSLRRGVSSN